MFDSDKILSNNMLLGQAVVLKGQELTINLIVFKMSDFNMILGMDFLSKYRVEIYCKKKKVKFNIENWNKNSFGEGRLRNLMINSVEAHKMLNKGYIEYLAHLINIFDSKVTLSMKGISVVCEFLDVFSDNLPMLALEREITFNIELAPRTTTISKAPYRMA